MRAMQGSAMKAPRSRWQLLGPPLLAVAALALAGCGDPDSREIARQVRKIETLIQTHRERVAAPGLFDWVEGKDHPPVDDPAREARHKALLQDLERLGHLEAFSMTDVSVRVDGDTATVYYRIQGRSTDPAEPPPEAGEFRFTRTPGGWTPSSNAFVRVRSPEPSSR